MLTNSSGKPVQRDIVSPFASWSGVGSYFVNVIQLDDNFTVIVHCFSALEVFLNDMRYINPRFTYFLTYVSMQLIPGPKKL